MTGYQELAKLIVFSISDVEELTENKKTAYSLIYRLMNKGLVKKIRNNIYSCVNPATGQVMANKFQIACASSNTAYLSHHSAFDYHSLINQQYSEIFISSDTRFRDFEFEGIKYKYIASKSQVGVIESNKVEKVRVTDLERTILDGIKDIDRFGKFENLIEEISSVINLDSEKLLIYLNEYNIQSLYQKTGFILEHFTNDFQLPETFFEYCKERIGKSTRYLSNDAKNQGEYIKDWKLVVSKNFFEIVN